jgi:hypothetical protein
MLRATPRALLPAAIRRFRHVHRSEFFLRDRCRIQVQHEVTRDRVCRCAKRVARTRLLRLFSGCPPPTTCRIGDFDKKLLLRRIHSLQSKQQNIRSRTSADSPKNRTSSGAPRPMIGRTTIPSMRPEGVDAGVFKSASRSIHNRLKCL